MNQANPCRCAKIGRRDVRNGDGCHFGRNAFGADGELTSAVQCNCSICTRSGFLHWRIEREQLRMLTPWEHLSSYIWGTGKARHFFCPVCGVAPLRVPRRKTEAGNDNVAVPSAAARPKQTQGSRG